MRIRLISAVAALATLAPISAHANASDAAGFTWTGMFIGINAGYGRGNSDWDFNGGGSNSHKLEGGIVGLQAGYNAQLQNNLVAGVELSVEATDADGSSGCAGGRCSSNFKSLTDLSGRLGVNYRSSLLFLKGGVAYQNIDHDISLTGSDKGGSLGYLVGGGVEFYIDNNITSNLEYNYYNFKDDSNQVGGTKFDASSDISVVKLGLNLKFN